jgi:hypothetical protein
MAECYFAILVKEGDSFRYVTREQTFDLDGSGVKTVVGGWTSGGNHLNLGGRIYTD